MATFRYKLLLCLLVLHVLNEVKAATFGVPLPETGRTGIRTIPRNLSEKEIDDRQLFSKFDKFEITVENRADFPITIFIFEQPAKYDGGPVPFSNSMGKVALKAHDPEAPDQAQFTLEEQLRAGAQMQLSPPIVGEIQVGKVSTALVNRKTDINSDLVKTFMTKDPNGFPELSRAVFDDSVQNGAFRITTPPFNPGDGPFSIGMSTVVDGVFRMSNYITAHPNSNLDVQPITKFYIARGDFTVGTVVNFSESSRNSAVCDATTGKPSFFVIYNANGTWSVS